MTPPLYQGASPVCTAAMPWGTRAVALDQRRRLHESFGGRRLGGQRDDQPSVAVEIVAEGQFVDRAHLDGDPAFLALLDRGIDQ